MPNPLPLGISSASLKEAFSEATLPLLAEAGFTHLEVYPAGHPQLAAEQLAPLGRRARACGLTTWSLHAPFGWHVNPAAADETARREAVGAITRALDQAEALGAGLVILHPGYYQPETEERETALLRVVRSYNELIKRASQRGLKLAMEYLPPKPQDLGCTAAELLWLQQLIDGEIGFCADVNHINLSEDLPTALRALAPSVLTTHLSDNDGQAERHWLPGQGVIDWPELVQTLQSVGYRGPLLLESGNFDVTGHEARVTALGEAGRGLVG